MLQEKKQKEERPWGSFEVLTDCKNYKVKRLILNPKKRFSLQKHFKRTENWIVVQGKVLVTIDKNSKTYSYGDTITILKGTAHRAENVGDEVAILIEIQTGEYFGEDDIVRIEDDFGRI